MGIGTLEARNAGLTNGTSVGFFDTYETRAKETVSELSG